jgi:hypothetical protein
MSKARLANRFIRATMLPCALIFQAIAAVAADLPDYYPSEGFGRTAIIDEFIADEQRIIVNDISYTLADNVIVHTPVSFSAPKTTLTSGDRVAFRLGGGRLIVEIWILPGDYVDHRQR